MRICDAIGNELRTGDTVVWQVGNAQFKATVVEAICPGQLSIHDEQLPGKLIVKVELKLVDPSCDTDIILPAFIKTFDPAGPRLLESVLGTKKIGRA